MAPAAHKRALGDRKRPRAVDHASDPVSPCRLQLLSSRFALWRGEFRGIAVSGACKRFVAAGWRACPHLRSLLRGSDVTVPVCRHPRTWTGKRIRRTLPPDSTAVPTCVSDLDQTSRGAGGLAHNLHSGAVGACQLGPAWWTRLS